MLRILSPIYSPNANPIEWAFAKVKSQFRKFKLEKLMKGKYVDVPNLIRRSFKTITTENARNYVQAS